MKRFKYFDERMTPIEAEKKLFSLLSTVDKDDYEKVKLEYKKLVKIVVPKYLKQNINIMTAY